MKLILTFGSEVKEYSYPDFDESRIRRNVLDFCLRHQTKKCKFTIIGEAEVNVCMDAEAEGLSALFG